MEILRNISIFDKETNKFLNFSKINIFFGYGKSGKTSFLKNINSIFLGKNRHTLVDGTITVTGDYNVFFLETKDGIKDHLKLSSKSLVRKLIINSKFSDNFNDIVRNVASELNKLKQEIESIILDSLPSLNFEINSIDDPLNLLLDNASLSLEIDSSTEDKEKLFSLINALTKNNENQTIVIIDDFNNDLDEESTIKFFEEMNKTNAYFFLTTKKAFPQYLIDDNVQLFTIRESIIYTIPSYERLALDALELKEDNHTFEEYMLGNGYLKGSNEFAALILQIKNDNMNNIFRILTSKSPVIANQPVLGKVTIIPKNDYEVKLYQHVFNILGLNNQ